MGCFSFLCKICGEPINCDGFVGEHVNLFLLEKGKVVEQLTGQYDSYGRVFDDAGNSVDWKSYPWSNYGEDEKAEKTICDVMSDKRIDTGICHHIKM